MAIERANTAAGLPNLLHPVGRRRWTYLVPVAVFGIVAIAFAIGLTLNPSVVPTVLVGKPVPEFELAQVKGRRRRGLSDQAAWRACAGRSARTADGRLRSTQPSMSAARR